MAGPAGFEPAHDGIKIRCLTAWLWPKHKMAVRTGLEPATSCVTGRHSNQLNYRTYVISKKTKVTRTGFEPVLPP